MVSELNHKRNQEVTYYCVMYSFGSNKKRLCLLMMGELEPAQGVRQASSLLSVCDHRVSGRVQLPSKCFLLPTLGLLPYRREVLKQVGFMHLLRSSALSV